MPGKESPEFCQCRVGRFEVDRLESKSSRSLHIDRVVVEECDIGRTAA
jgi:hypothetical protein